jgi:hypothetical protein
MTNYDRLPQLFFDALAGRIGPQVEEFERGLRAQYAAHSATLKPLQRRSLEDGLQQRLDAYTTQLLTQVIDRILDAAEPKVETPEPEEVAP